VLAKFTAHRRTIDFLKRARIGVGASTRTRTPPHRISEHTASRSAAYKRRTSEDFLEYSPYRAGACQFAAVVWCVGSRDKFSCGARVVFLVLGKSVAGEISDKKRLKVQCKITQWDKTIERGLKFDRSQPTKKLLSLSRRILTGKFLLSLSIFSALTQFRYLLAAGCFHPSKKER
jgi:hypothetical protein